MNAKAIRRNLYKVLRKTGVPKERISEDASFRDELFADELDMNFFLFFLETRFDLAIKNDEIVQLTSVKSTIDYLQRHCA
ncbi:acyl carrier protein [Carboxylicivirga sp. N1Y90]|uniref:acyl carrier protein n=1 Tax=Carboxylicivirga fragile TaxID=3417571 RepID=UPI003D340CF4|nr:acyl carrier protein [Marinilabiliaceae bacterium N1Y90]